MVPCAWICASGALGSAATGEQPLCFVDQTNHDMRIGWYTDTYRRTADGWRLVTRSMTRRGLHGERSVGAKLLAQPAVPSAH
jgi:hypothetical protein